MIRRNRPPNEGCWSPPGGKLEMSKGESPVECARRECLEETGLATDPEDLHLFGYISEKAYEGNTHWLMFLVSCLKPVPSLPAAIDEGPFGFFARSEIDRLEVPPTDRLLVWPFYDRYRNSFVAVRADCGGPGDPVIEVETAVELNRPEKPPGQFPE